LILKQNAGASSSGSGSSAMSTQIDDILGLPLPQNTTYTAAFGQTEWVEWSTISITTLMNLAVALICLMAFWSMRQRSPGYFSLKRARCGEKSTPPDLPTGMFNWMWSIMALSDEQVVQYAGFDALIFLRFYKMAFKVSERGEALSNATAVAVGAGARVRVRRRYNGT
jgi:Late exocytosis, associated with Golgi transport